MFDFLRRDQPGIAAVFFPGSAPPPSEAFLRLRNLGYRLTEGEPGDRLWSIGLEHPDLGAAELTCERTSQPLADVIEFANNLTDGEKAAAAGSASSVVLRVPARRREVLRDRKTMLRIANDVLGDDGVMVLDVASQLPWSRAALADELAHDADLDIEALYCLHNVLDDGAPETAESHWLHSHGLGELGGFDLDIMAPHPAFVAQCGELFRALGTMVLERSIAADADRFVFGHPGGEARLVPTARFMREADPSYASLRDATDHDERRSVVCEPAGRRLFGIGGKDRPEPLRFARRPPPDQFVIYFPNAMTALTEHRARATLDVLRDAMVEFAEFEPTAIVKLGYPTPSGGREHLWFTVHAIGADSVDATLENTPFEADLAAGERAERPLELLTDWALITPAGWIHPRSQTVARQLREDADLIRAAMAEGRRS